LIFVWLENLHSYFFPLFFRYLKGWTKFVDGCRLCLKLEITTNELRDIETLFSDFVVHYEKKYYRRETARLLAVLIFFHYLLHIAKFIRNTGPAWATWQYPMERLCGMLLPLVRSRQHPYTNLTNQITIWSQFSHLQCFPDINKRVFGDLADIDQPEENRNFKVIDGDEVLVPPMRKHIINQSEKRLLRTYYATAQKIRPADLGVFIQSFSFLFPFFF
jgi:hypothetical protein